MALPTPPSKPIPALPILPVVPLADLSKVYIMFYRHGMSVGVSKGFIHEGDINSASSRAREHCKIMGYHYTFTLPLITDLQRDEDYKNGRLAHKPKEGEPVL